ncbi:DUF4864 domain-containing protein [Candidatus Puniceispirillum marinum]|uniref:DUF4864 domain-containing protein n=1 Tax=Puniceispirillum marinum (strain IMCC1322) TaxID=488538 RepID=D5BN98_PUNMI|nr:hypothetical protein [Candidatus Puniceispirillum marinum]ADE40291.1 hypothetical protein SAR116_2048 [Candidatus Puniceispirillum marinum IMCC1322]
MIKFFRLFLFIMLGCFGALASASGTEVVAPNPDIAPQEVVDIQLTGLQNNDNPERDFGIRQTWAFAHPGNRRMTGPYPRFAQMIRSPSYIEMIDHASHSISLAKQGEGWQQFDVLMETKGGNVLFFSWVVEKVTEGECKGCWMTTAVSAPSPAGQGS